MLAVNFFSASLLLVASCGLLQVASASTTDVWGPCPSSVIDQPQLPPFYVADCANLTVPLDWTGTSGSNATINLWVTRLSPSTGGPVDTHLWMLQGGAGRGSVWLSLTFETEWASIDVPSLFGNRVAFLLPDKRGTGLSSPLTCVNWYPDASCQQELLSTWGRDGLGQFTDTNSGRDLEHLITTLSVPEVGNNVHIYAWSHGTYVAQKYLHFRTLEPLSMVLDGIVPSDVCQTVDMDSQVDLVGRELLGLCDMDPWCSQMWNGQDVTVVLQKIYQLIENNASCFDRLESPQTPFKWGLQHVLAALMSDDFVQGGRTAIPALIYRVLRCNDNDVNALNTLFRLMQTEGQDSYPPDLPMLFNAMASEMLLLDPDAPYPLADLEQEEQLFLMTSHLALTVGVDMYSWPKYKVDQYFHSIPPFGQIPIFVVNGDLDPQTPFYFASHLASKIKEQGNTKSRLITINKCTHGTLFNSPVTDSPVPCTLSILASIVTSPTQTPDISCIAKLRPLDWQGSLPETEAVSSTLFGTTDLWQLQFKTTSFPNCKVLTTVPEK